MKRVSLPMRRFRLEDYPNLAPDSIGRIVPVGYGAILGAVPVEIDTAIHRYKILDQAVQEITQLRKVDGTVLVKNTHYQEYLTSGEFRLTYNAFLHSGITYYLAICGDYPISDSAYLELGQNYNQYADGRDYTVDANGVWSTGTPGNSLRFQIYGRLTPTSDEVVIATNITDTSTWSIYLRDSDGHTRIGQSFKLSVSTTPPNAPYYPTRIRLLGGAKTSPAPSGNIWAVLYQGINPDDIYAALSAAAVASGFNDDFNLTITGWDEMPDIECDVKAPGTELTKIADILPDVIGPVMGKDPDILDATSLANLASLKTQALGIYLNEEIEFGDFVAKLEAGQMWKLIPKQDGTYMTIVAEVGEPANTPHFRDHHFLSFKMELDSSKVRHIANVFYAEDSIIKDFYAVQKTSDIARFFHMNEQTINIETYLAEFADADPLAMAYLARYESLIITVVFEVHGWALDLLPFRDKVKLTRKRAPYIGGCLDGVLFRIVKLVKTPENNIVEITACIWGNSAT